MPRSILALSLAAGAIAALACFAEDRETLPLGPPALSHGGDHTISGVILGPDATSICNSIPNGSTVAVRVIDPVNLPPGGGAFVGGANVTCPDNGYEIAVPPGSYRMRVQLPADPGIGALPFRSLVPAATDIVVGGADVVQDITILNGTPLGGSLTIDGMPLAGERITLVYDLATPILFGAAFGISGADGEWDGRVPARSPMRVQPGVRYRFFGGIPCPALGTRVVASTIPRTPFLFPDDVSAIFCTMETGPAATEFSHERTRLVATSMPADIGGSEGDLFDLYGRGWGVQFPIEAAGPVHVPVNASHLFTGGLIIGLAPDVVLSGNELSAYGLDCGASCRDLGADASATVAPLPTEGKIIHWTYSDAASGDGVGLKVVQHSFDGQPPSDYVLFQFTISNQSEAALTLYAGFFGDWDVDTNIGDDVGFSDLDGRLMYAVSTDPDDGGTHVGSLLLGDYPVAGQFFFDNATRPQSLSDQVEALSGAISRPSFPTGTDLRVIHSLGPITLQPDGEAEIWIGIVAGEDKPQLLANAAAVAAQVED